MNLVDVHSHLNHESFKEDFKEVLARAKKAGLKAIIVSGTNTAANKQVLELAKKDPIIKVSLGIHPIDALGLSEGETGIPKQHGPVDLEEEFKFIEKHKKEIVAIGEVGLDFHWDKEYHEEQKEVFRKIIGLAVRIKKPLVVHTWEAEAECLDILEKEAGNKIPVILHCFGGRKALITRAKELGYYFTIPPSIVRNSGAFGIIVQKVDLKQLLTETDAPWQSLSREQRNEPAKVLEAIKKIAEIKKIPVEEAAEQIWKNYQQLFSTTHTNLSARA